MQKHLSDDELTQAMVGTCSPGADQHLAHCSVCRDEQERLQRALGGLADWARAAGERLEAFWEGQRAAIAARVGERASGHRAPVRWMRGLAWAGAVGVLVLAALLMEKSPPASQVAVADADHALLVEVERTVRRELPRALEPAALLTQEMSQAVKPKP